MRAVRRTPSAWVPEKQLGSIGLDVLFAYRDTNSTQFMTCRPGYRAYHQLLTELLLLRATLQLARIFFPGRFRIRKQTLRCQMSSKKC